VKREGHGQRPKKVSVDPRSLEADQTVENEDQREEAKDA
jgi:hypothetical protein